MKAIRTIGAALLLAGCTRGGEVRRGEAPPAPPPTVSIDVGAPWSLQRSTEASLAFAVDGGPDGIRVQLSPGEEGRVAGVTPILGGRTLETEAAGTRWPLVSLPYSDRPLSRVQVKTEGPDLVVRAFGPPISVVFPFDGAPDDPVLTWVRVRKRPTDWRIVVDGLARVSLPAEGTLAARRPETEPVRGAPPVPEGPVVSAFELRTAAWGSFEVETSAPKALARTDGGLWTWTNLDSLIEHAPYPRTSLEWTPPGAPASP